MEENTATKTPEAPAKPPKKYTDIIEVINAIQVKRAEMLERDIRAYPRTHFIASDIPDCDKYLTHAILDWEKKEKFTPAILARLKVGNQEERNLIAELTGLGYNIIHTQAPFEIKNKAGEMICRGQIDGKIQVDRQTDFPVEFKSISPYLFDQIDTYDDLDKLPHLRKYKRQMQLYLYGHNKEVGTLLFSNLLGAWKFIPVYLDYGEVEFILKRLENAWELVKRKEYGRPILFNEKICGKCSFRHICLPDAKYTGAEMLEDIDLEALLARREALRPVVKEYDKLDEQAKGMFKNTDESRVLFVGVNWRIDVVVREGMRLNTKNIPEDIKAQYEVPSKTRTVSFTNIEPEKSELDTTGKKSDIEKEIQKGVAEKKASPEAPVQKPARKKKTAKE